MPSPFCPLKRRRTSASSSAPSGSVSLDRRWKASIIPRSRRRRTPSGPSAPRSAAAARASAAGASRRSAPTRNGRARTGTARGRGGRSRSGASGPSREASSGPAPRGLSVREDVSQEERRAPARRSPLGGRECPPAQTKGGARGRIRHGVHLRSRCPPHRHSRLLRGFLFGGARSAPRRAARCRRRPRPLRREHSLSRPPSLTSLMIDQGLADWAPSTSAASARPKSRHPRWRAAGDR